MPITFKNLGNYGRMGNSMFQAAATIALAARNNDDYIFPLCFLKDILSIPTLKFVRFNKINFSRTCDKPSHTYEEPYFHYTPIPYRKNLNINGYFQTEKHFLDHRKLVSKLLMPRNVSKPIEGAASLHIRRGDYLQPHLKGCFHVLGLDYYKEAMKLIGAKKYLVFSDDIVWCKKVFIGPEFEIMEGNSPVEDLSLQIACEHNIIANSSFSWWGAWLNPNKEKTVIAPRKWFGPKLIPTHNTKDLIPGGWVRI